MTATARVSDASQPPLTRHAGKAARAAAPARSHAEFEPAADRSDPVDAARAPGAHARARARPDPLRPHARVAVHVLPRRGGDHGRGPRVDPAVGAAGAVLRRRAPVELRRLRLARPAARLRPQRLRRDAAGAVGVGRQAARREHADRGRRATGSGRTRQRRAVLDCVAGYRTAMAGFAGDGQPRRLVLALRDRERAREVRRRSSSRAR